MSPLQRSAGFQPPTAGAKAERRLSSRRPWTESGAAAFSRRFGDCRCWWNACPTTVNVARQKDRTGDWKDRRSCRSKRGQEGPRVERRLSCRRPRERRLVVAGSEIAAAGGTPAWTTVNVVRQEDRTGDWKDRRSCRSKRGQEGHRVERRLSSRRPRERRLVVAGSEIAAAGGTPAWTTVNVVRQEDRTGDWKDRRSCRSKRGQEGHRVERRLSCRRPWERRLVVAGSEIAAAGGTPARPQSTL